ncbi:MAG: chromosome segregation protein SMC [Firmicutes bacterium]|nr:chromosome segregation protein SMC [Bacillota bacterium]
MFLKRLEVYGFKSFAEKTELAFTEGITAIVGPNGSGKSNVGDAVRWVLGEQSAKQLRGGKMEDIIFNGTEKRKKLSFCEVTLVFDNQDRALPIDYTEVAITRRLYRSGESEYCINRAPCRLKDVSELLMDTGIGKEGYSIIGQGKIDNILSNKAEERRGVFEEAAGIMKYKTRKLEAERRLERTSENIERLNDILSELSDRIEPLREQSETAQKYLAIREELRELEVNFYLYQYDMAARRKDEINSALESVDGEYAEKERLRGEIQKAEQQGSEVLAALEQELEGLRTRILDLTAKIEQGSGQNRVYCERAAHLNQEVARLEGELRQDEESRESLLAARGGDKKALEDKQRDITAAEAHIAGQEAAVEERDRLLEQESQALEAMRGEIMEAMNRLSDEKVNAGRYEAMRSGIQARLEQIDGKKKELLHELESIGEAAEQQRRRGEQLAQYYAELSGQRDEARAELEGLRTRREGVQAQAQQTAERLQAAAQKASMLQEMKNDYESFNNSVRHILKDKQNNPALSRAVSGVVAQLISVPRDYERAVETALGAAVQNIVTPTEEDAKFLIDYLKRGNLGRATFLPISAVKSRRLEASERAAIKVKGCFGVASELVSFEEKYRGVMENLLGRTVICDGMDTCIAIARACGHSIRLVTLDGDVMNPGGSMTGGSRQSRLTSLLGRTRELEEAQQERDRLAAEHSSLRGKAAELTRREEKAAEALAGLESAVHGAEAGLAEENRKLGKLEDDAALRRETLEALEQEASGHADTLNEISGRLQGSSGQVGSIERDTKAAQEQLSARTAEYNAKKLERERCVQQLTQLKMRHSAMVQELSAMRSDAERIDRELAELDRRRAHNTGKIEDCRRQIEVIDSESVSSGKQVELLKAEFERARESMEGLDSKKQAAAQESAERTRRERELEKDLSAAQEKKHKFELSLQKVDADIALMEQRVWDEYELTYLSASELRKPDFKPAGVQSDINRLRRDIGALGAVNVNAIEEYISTKERYESLTSQLEDLDKAKQDLNKIISDMVKKMESRFTEQFAVINKYFGETFRQLFGGGRAELRLENAQDVLGSGIDIVAQPPGKSLQMLSLLSGGERALTAIAILFAMLRLKPTPFCILDEIEAALDEPNVYNFAEYMRSFTDKTQFIVITHRKPTMEEADSLYGVAMEEKGVSRMVSVKLSEVN